MAPPRDSSFKYPDIILTERLKNLLMEAPSLALSKNNTYEDYSIRNPPRLRPFIFLSLPPEIRNTIYRHLLIHQKPVKLGPSFRIGDTNLLCTNRQIYGEAREMFYHENVFVIPEAVFTGDLGILDALEGPLYRLPRQRLALLRKMIVHIPIFGPGSHHSLRDQVLSNLTILIRFLQGPPTGMLRLFVIFHIKPGVDDLDITPELLRPLLVEPQTCPFSRECSFARVRIHVLLGVHPKWLLETKYNLVSSFAHTYMLVGFIEPNHWGSKSKHIRNFWAHMYYQFQPDEEKAQNVYVNFGTWTYKPVIEYSKACDEPKNQWFVELLEGSLP